jgi:hypothetical protein
LPTPYLEAQQESCKAERLSVSVKRARDCLNCRDLRLPARRIHRVSLGPKRDYLGVSTVGCQICKKAPSGRALMAASSAEQRSPHTRYQAAESAVGFRSLLACCRRFLHEISDFLASLLHTRAGLLGSISRISAIHPNSRNGSRLARPVNKDYGVPRGRALHRGSNVS